MEIIKSSSFFISTIENNHVFVLGGPSGTGKTELALNLATFFERMGILATVIDLDFTKGDFTLRSNRFRTYVPIPQRGEETRYGNVPHIPQKLLQHIEGASHDRRFIIDLGGNERGMQFLQIVKPVLKHKRVHVTLVTNFFRPFFEAEEHYQSFASRIERGLDFRFHSVIANSHLMEFTTWEVLARSWQKTQNLVTMLSSPLFFATVWGKTCDEEILGECLSGAIVRIKRFLDLPWRDEP